MTEIQSITLLELNRRVTSAIAVTPGLQGVWITAETSDLRSSGGHCYMELVQKDERTGTPLAKSRAVMWASAYQRLGAMFYAATGTRLRSDMKIMARVNANYHPVYGMSLVITDINPDYTVGDLARRRNEIIARLRAEGVFDMNRNLPWPQLPVRVAIVSARGAAGYGDFMKHLHGNPLHLRFHTELFEATMQGERTVPSVVAALEAIAARDGDFDCVVLIRGGGAVSDLASFDDYTLASNVAQFPLPVIVGIGHERDVTVLDYVANTRVKTPTAAAEALIGMASNAYERLRATGDAILTLVKDRIAGQRQQLAYYQGSIPALARSIVERNRQRLDPEIPAAITAAVRSTFARANERLGALGVLLDTLSPEATLRRGYTITRVDGHAVTAADPLDPGTVITTTFAGGRISKSTINN